MYRYIRQIFNKPNNVHRLHRTISGLDKKHIEKGNYIKAVDLLVKAGINKNAINAFGKNALEMATEYNYTEIINILIN